MNDLNENSDSEGDQTAVNFLKEHFSLEDYLKHPETKAILEQMHLWAFTKKCEEDIINYYVNDAKKAAASDASIFAYDPGGHHAGTLAGLVYKYIEPEYDLTVFYDYPHLAQSLIEDHESIKQREEEERIRKRRELYLATKNVGKKFDWATKTYK